MKTIQELTTAEEIATALFAAHESCTPAELTSPWWLRAVELLERRGRELGCWSEARALWIERRDRARREAQRREREKGAQIDRLARDAARMWVAGPVSRARRIQERIARFRFGGFSGVRIHVDQDGRVSFELPNGGA